MNTNLSRKDAVGLYGGNLTHLAKALGVTRAAVYLWPEDAEVPEWVYLKLRFVLKPDDFTGSGKLRKRRNLKG